jgi:hypothetical protein
MTTFALAAREGVRLAQFSRLRSLVVVVPIAVATAVGLCAPEVAFGCSLLSFAVLAVARRSPRMERMKFTEAWRSAGASKRAIWAASTIEALLLGWGGVLLGTAVVIVPLVVMAEQLSWRMGYAGAQLAVIAVAACLPTVRTRSAGMRRAQKATRAVGVLLSAVIAAFLAVQAYAIAVSIDDSFGLALGGFLVLVSLTLAIALVTGPLNDGAMRALATVRPARALHALCQGRRFPAAIRFVVVLAIVVVATTSVLGASVEARPEADRTFDRRLVQLPVVPADVAMIRLSTPPSPTEGADANLSADVIDAVRAAVPGAELIPLHRLPEAPLSCAFGCSGRFIVSDPRLRAVFGDGPTYPADEYLPPMDAATMTPVQTFTRVPPRSELQRAFVQQGQLPQYSFAGVEFLEVRPGDARGLGRTKVQDLFVHAPEALTDAERLRLAQVARDSDVPTGTSLELVTSDSRVPSSSEGANLGGTDNLREQPWASTSSGIRWSSALVAALLALGAVMAALTIDTLDRRRDVERLERLGATPAQVRGAAALRTGMLFVVVTWTTMIVTTVLVRNGVHEYSDRHPESPIPFVLPWPVVLFLTVGLPVLAAALAALVARPLRDDTVAA